MENRDYLNIKWDKLIGKGENPKGFTAQTANGTAKAGDNPGWNRNQPSSSPQGEASGVWKDGNRTGE